MRPVLTLPVLAVALALAGCSGSGGSDPKRSAAPSAPAPTSAAPTPSPSSSPASSGEMYLALGDSLAAGYQPGGAELRDSAYPALAAGRLDRAGASLTVENLACSGETTTSLLEGGRCDYDTGSQLDEAVAVLEENAGEVGLVSIDIGGNDLLGCVGSDLTVDEPCVTRGLASVTKNLPGVLDRLTAAAGPDVPVLVVGYYNPWLASGFLGRGADELAVATRAFDSLDDAIEAAAEGSGATYVSLAEAFALDDETPTTFGGREVPTNVAQVCTLTFICTEADIHLTGEGAAVVGREVADAAEAAGVGA